MQEAKDEFQKYGTEYDPAKVVEQANEIIEGKKMLGWLKDNCEITVLPYEKK